MALVARVRADEAPCLSISQVVLYVLRKTGTAWRSSSMVSKVWTQRTFFAGADDPLGAAVSLGSADERRRALDAREFYFPLKIRRHVLRSMVVAYREAPGDVFVEPTQWRLMPWRIGSRTSKRVARA